METIARSVVHSVNPRVPLENVATLNELVQESVSAQRIRAMVLSFVAVAALLLAALGLYGVLAYSVAQRTTEIGIRMALGSSASQLFRLIVVDGLRPVDCKHGMASFDDFLHQSITKRGFPLLRDAMEGDLLLVGEMARFLEIDRMQRRRQRKAMRAIAMRKAFDYST